MPARLPAPIVPARHAPLTAILRGGTVESVHYGSVAVVDRDGRLVHAAGDPDAVIFTRSALKPLQALPFVAAGGLERFGYTEPETALLCASHSGEPRHVEAAAAMLAKAGNTAADLKCGSHAPMQFDARGEVPPPPPYSPLAHNCSGKHSGMLAHCAACGYGRHGYLDHAHPLQQEIRVAVSRMSGVPETALVAGVDGCSAPNYAMPLARLAYAFACLASPDDDPVYGRAPRRLADAMLRHPEMVSGERRSDLALSRAGRGDFVCKIGAEGVQAIGVRSRGLGVALKVADGSARGLHPATVAVLDQLGLLDRDVRDLLAPWAAPTLRNFRGLAVGEARAAVVLDKIDRPL
ncbi:MAG: asparaginase [Burkholderiales bacterium]|nr:asparaginase [Burkholderiales bacterium]